MAFLHASGEHFGKVEIEGRVIQETPKAVCVELDGERQEWLPKRGLVIEPLRNGLAAIFMPLWVAREKKLI